MPQREFRSVIETNLLGTMAVTKSVIAEMRKKRSGHVVMMSSTGGIAGLAGFSAYAASKFGIEGMSESLAWS